MALVSASFAQFAGFDASRFAGRPAGISLHRPEPTHPAIDPDPPPDKGDPGPTDPPTPRPPEGDPPSREPPERVGR
ncbi:hypothetical protein [Burkholderia sp. 3C]